MLGGKRILAVVPARSGSKGIADKNMQSVGGMSLIARAGRVLAACDFVDYRMISTDAERYADEGRKNGLEAPSLRPAELSDDKAGAIETMQHALTVAEAATGTRFDVILIIEPTSPLRTPDDLRRATALLVESGADSVVTVSPLAPKGHPQKLLEIRDGRLEYHLPSGASITSRQQLADGYYWRDGLCYALTRDALMTSGAIFTGHTLPLVTERAVVNIDEPIELKLAELLLEQADQR